MNTGAASWSHAMLAAKVLALVPHQLGGAVVYGFAGPVRDAWAECLWCMVPESTRRTRIHPATDLDNLEGGLDIASTLRSGKSTYYPGLFERCRGGFMEISFAEQLPPMLSVSLAKQLIGGKPASARVTYIAYDSGHEDDPPVNCALASRLALRVDLSAVSYRELAPEWLSPEQIQALRMRIPDVALTDELLAGLCRTAGEIGVHSLAVPSYAARVARAISVLKGEDQITAEHAVAAMALTYPPELTSKAEQQADPNKDAENKTGDQTQDRGGEDVWEDHLDMGDFSELTALYRESVQSGRVHLPKAGAMSKRVGKSSKSGRRGPDIQSFLRGRRTGTVISKPVAGRRIDVLATLRHALPRQAWRTSPATRAGEASDRIIILAEDIHLHRFKQHAATTTIFVVDASGSAALERLAEVKGAVEYLLAECYVRRDEVALVVFRGRQAEILLPPTRSLVRAKRTLSGLAGGGGTPLASGLELARNLALRIERQGSLPFVAVLTDGRANVNVSGEGGRDLAKSQALASAALLGDMSWPVLCIDVSARKGRDVEPLARKMNAEFIHLPHAGAQAVAATVHRAQRGLRGHA